MNGNHKAAQASYKKHIYAVGRLKEAEETLSRMADAIERAIPILQQTKPTAVRDDTIRLSITALAYYDIYKDDLDGNS